MSDKSTIEYVRGVLDTIETCGHVVQYVFDHDEETPPFAYTVGLCTREGHPYELACSGVAPNEASTLLNATPEIMVRDGIQPGEGVEIPDVLVGLPPRLRLCTDTGNFPLARAIYGEFSPTWQVLYPDPDGRYPGDPLCTNAEAQVLL